MKIRWFTPASCALALLSVPVMSHHSATAYNFESPAVLAGTVTEYEWSNPHVYIYLQSLSDSGDVTSWTIEGMPPALMRRSGWTAETLQTGEVVSLQVFSNKNPASATAMLSPMQRAEGLLEDTRSYFDAAVDASATGVATSIFGTWAGVRAPEAMASDDWPLTDRSREALEAFTDTESPSARCVAGAAPGAMTFPDFKQIEDRGDTIIIRAEFDNIERVVRMESNAASETADSIQGYSTGRWDADVLIVETSQFAEHRSGNGYGIPSSAGKRLTERFSLNDAADSLIYSFELTDPEYFTEPVIRQMQWAYRPDVEYSGLPCDLDNARRFLYD